MIPAAFEYVRAKSVEEALSLLEEHGEDAKLLAGGHSVIPMMKLRLLAPSVLIDIGRLPIASIERDGNRVTIGALAKHAALAASDDLRSAAPALWDAANQLGDPQVRNRGTVGGACAHGDPSADYPAVMLALGATMTVTAKSGPRNVSADDFFVGMFETDLAGGVLTSIAFDAAPHSAYVKYHHPASHYALVGAAVKLEMNGDVVGSARIAVTGIGDMAFRAKRVEEALAGVNPSDTDAVTAACANAAQGVDTRSDIAASAEYRRAMADVFVARAVRAALR